MLNATALPELAARGIHTPRYRHDAPPGVVHLGLGAFHRAHQALVFDDLLSRGDTRWGVFGVAMHNPVVVAALDPDGHPNSPTSGHPKLPHPDGGVTMV